MCAGPDIFERKVVEYGLLHFMREGNPVESCRRRRHVDRSNLGCKFRRISLCEGKAEWGRVEEEYPRHKTTLYQSGARSGNNKRRKCALEGKPMFNQSSERVGLRDKQPLASAHHTAKPYAREAYSSWLIGTNYTSGTVTATCTACHIYLR